MHSAMFVKITLHEQKCLIPAVEHGSGGIMILAWFAATGPGALQTTRDSSVDQRRLQ